MALSVMHSKNQRPGPADESVVEYVSEEAFMNGDAGKNTIYLV
jgi:hypothetical protein